MVDFKDFFPRQKTPEPLANNPWEQNARTVHTALTQMIEKIDQKPGKKPFKEHTDVTLQLRNGKTRNASLQYETKGSPEELEISLKIISAGQTLVDLPLHSYHVKQDQLPGGKYIISFDERGIQTDPDAQGNGLGISAMKQLDPIVNHLNQRFFTDQPHTVEIHFEDASTGKGSHNRSGWTSTIARDMGYTEKRPGYFTKTTTYQ